MSDLKKVTSRGYPGMLVFAKIIKNIDYDGVLHEDVYEYYDRLSAGFILEVSKSFEQYYLVRFFSGEKSYHWGTDLFEKTFPKHLTSRDK